MLERIREARKTQNGFTLIELLIVILVLAILATIVLFATGTFTSESKTSACKANAKIVNIAEAAYAAQHNGATTDTPSDLATYIQDGYPTDNAPTLSGGKATPCA